MERKFALIIGNSEYQDPSLTQLKAPHADVLALKAVLSDPNIGAFDEVRDIINQPFIEVLKEISMFYNDRKRDDVLLLYFSGHGVRDANGRLYLTVKDSEKDLLDATSIPTSFISNKLSECRSKRKILILDCCHSGAWQVGAKGVPETPAVTRDTFQGYGHVVMTASDKTEFALDSLEEDKRADDLSLSLFTNYLLQGLRTGQADIGNDGWVDVDEWFDYARDQVIGQASNQKPKIWKFDTEGELRIARNPNPKEVQLAPHLVTMIESDFYMARLEAVGQLAVLLVGKVRGMAELAADRLQHMALHDDSNTVRQQAAQALKGTRWDLEHAETKDLSGLYSSATAAMQAHQWEEAERHLLEIEKREPGYKDTGQLLKQVSAELEQIRRQNLAALYADAMEAVEASNWSKAQGLFKQIEQQEPGYANVRQRLMQVEAEIRLQASYNNAMEAIRAENWQDAHRRLLEIEKSEPGYRDVAQLLKEVSEELEQFRKQNLETLYAKAKRASDAKNWREALPLLKQLEKEKPGFEDVRRRLNQAETEIGREDLYDRAMQAIRNEKWVEAHSLLKRLKAEAPGYRDVGKRLDEVVKKEVELLTGAPKKTGQPAGGRIFWVIGAVILLLVAFMCVALFTYCSVYIC